MLEHPALLIHDWQPADHAEAAPAWTRAIATSARQPLGFVRLAGETGTSWFSWLRKVQLDLFETDDASHLMSVTRSWGMLRAWDVHDADDRHIGVIHPKTLMTGDRERLGFLDFESNDKGRVLDPVGQQLAAYARAPGTALVLTFEPQPTANPFLRMLILASVLTLEAAP
jgi:hypothetical protein